MPSDQFAIFKSNNPFGFSVVVPYEVGMDLEMARRDAISAVQAEFGRIAYVQAGRLLNSLPKDAIQCVRCNWAYLSKINFFAE